MTPQTHRSRFRGAWAQLPFFAWLVAVWMMLWGQFSVLAALSGIVVAVFVTRVFRLPPVELSGRISLWHAFVFAVLFFGAVIAGSLQVAWVVLNPRREPGTAVIAVPLRTDDDLIMTHVGVTASLIPGSLVTEIDRRGRVMYLHVIGVHSLADVEAQREKVLTWEKRLVRAFGSREQYAELRREEAAS